MNSSSELEQVYGGLLPIIPNSLKLCFAKAHLERAVQMPQGRNHDPGDARQNPNSYRRQQGLNTSVASTAPLGRIERPNEIETRVAFLPFDDASAMAGTEIVVDVGSSQI